MDQSDWQESQALAVLQSPLSLFSELPETSLLALIRTGQIRELRKGYRVACTNTVVNKLHILLQGMFRVHNYSAAGNEHLISFLEPGNAFGFISCIDRQANPHEVVADSNCISLVIDATDLKKLIHQDSHICDAVLNFLCLRLRMTFLEMDAYAIGSPQQRLAKRLVYLAQSIGVPQPSQGIAISLTQDALGAMIGLSRQGTNKLLNRFADEGLIERDYGKIVILDVERLNEIDSE